MMPTNAEREYLSGHAARLMEDPAFRLFDHRTTIVVPEWLAHLTAGNTDRHATFLGCHVIAGPVVEPIVVVQSGEFVRSRS